MFTLRWVVATGDVRLGGETESLVALVVDVERSDIRAGSSVLY